MDILDWTFVNTSYMHEGGKGSICLGYYGMMQLLCTTYIIDLLVDLSCLSVPKRVCFCIYVMDNLQQIAVTSSRLDRYSHICNVVRIERVLFYSSITC